MTTDIQLIESKGRFFVAVKLDGHESHYGPYRDPNKAEAEARRIAGVCQVLLHQPAHIAPMRASRRRA